MTVCTQCHVETSLNPITNKLAKTKYLIVRNFPDTLDQIMQEHLISDAGKLLKGILQEQCIDLSDASIVYLACCNPGNDEEGKQIPLTKEQILLSSSKILQVIKEQMPDKVILLGVDSVNAVWGYGHKKNGRDLKDFRGMWTTIPLFDDYDIPAYVVYEPRSVMVAPTAFFDDFRGDFSRFRQVGWLEQPKVVKVESYVDTAHVLKKCLQRGYEPGDEGVRAFDIETTGLNYHSESTDKVVSLSICADPKTVYIWSDKALASRQISKALQEYFYAPQMTFVGHNALHFDCPFLWVKLGLDVPVKYDTMLLHYVLDERRGTHGLKRLGLRYFGIPNWEQGVNAAKEKQKLNGLVVNYGDIEELLLYNYQAYDTAVTWLLYYRFIVAVKEDYNDLYHNIIYPAARLLENLHTRGMKVDVPYLIQLGKEWENDLLEYSKKLQTILEQYGCSDLNLNSTQQLSKFLHGPLKLHRVNAKTIAKSGAGKMKDKYDSASEAVLNYLESKDTSGFVSALLSYRRLTSLKGRYVDGMLKLVSPQGFIYPNLLLHGTETGRLSCTKPNLQAIPKHDKDGRKEIGLTPYADQIRHAFIPRPGFKLVSSDYAQIELRYLAWASEDPVMIEAFASGLDFHQATADKAFGITDDPILKAKWRQWAKTINFMLVYGGSAKALAAQLNLYLEQATLLMKAVLDAFPKLAKYMINEKIISLKRGYTVSAFGRRRRFELVPDQKFKAEFERSAGNHPPQSGANDICLQAAIEIDRTFDEEDVNVLLLIHDDILMEVNENKLDILIPQIVAIQEKHRLKDKGFKFMVDPTVSDRWKKIDKDEVHETIIEQINNLEEELTAEEIYAN
jgi:DNA polymerase I-like protein with 3'-5' exonuclease and polymerase domains